MIESTPPAYFDALYRSADPYGFRQRWYEQRKRSLLLASLMRRRYDSAWEIGCSNGEVTAALALICTQVLATDLSARAVELARARTAASGNVVVEQAHHPGDWPEATFDLIVFSEVGYFMSRDDLEATSAGLQRSLRDGGLLVACHWLTPFNAAPLSGHEVHEVLRASLRLDSCFCYADQDFMLEGWSSNPTSVAVREGLR